MDLSITDLRVMIEAFRYINTMADEALNSKEANLLERLEAELERKVKDV